MLIQLIVAVVVGILAGTITGLIPGIHVNLISVILIGFSAFLLSYFSPLILVVFLVSMALTHTFIDYIPSIFLGAPDEDSFLSVLPGHELLLEGRAFEAVILTLYGSLFAVLIILLLSPLFIFILPLIYNYISIMIPWILILASIFLIYFEKTDRTFAIIIFILAGFLGISSLNLGIREPLLPLLTGLFGASSLITSIMKKEKIPKQKIVKFRKIKIKKKLFRPLLASILTAPLASFLPGIGAGQSAVIGSEIVGGKEGEMDRKEFLIFLGSINTIIAGLAFIGLYSVGKARTGVVVAVKELIPSLTFSNLLIIFLSILLVSFVSFFITIFLAGFFAKNITRIKYNKISLLILLVLSLIVFVFSGFLGLLVFLISASLGLLCILLGVKRTHLMGSLMIPTILIYLL